MKFLIEAGTFPENEALLCKTLEEMGIEYSLWNPEGRPHYKANDNHVFFYGQITSALALKRAGARFQIWLGHEFDYTYFGAHLTNLLNPDIVVMPYGMMLKEYEKNKKVYDKSYDLKDKMFFRSNSGYKKFPGGLYNQPEFFEQIKQSNIFKEDLIFCAERKEIIAEYRAVVRSRYDEASDSWVNKIITSSAYPNDGHMPAHYVEKIEEDLNNSTYHPYPMWILDIAVTDNNELRILETNSLNTSGLYECCLKRIIEEILNVEKEEII